ncbi:MAG: efflux RND transporter periplasmic adaptor subunit [bacterium]|nr:efflux RND transporter periplasmic adaptor subunit [bacterium]
MRKNSKQSSFGHWIFGACNLFVIWCLVLGISILAGCGKKVAEIKVAKIPVRVTKVKRVDIKEVLSYVGDIKAEDEAIVYPKVTGKIIEKLAKEGDAVKKGDVLTYIDRDEIGLKFEKSPVTSPIDGIIGRIYVDKGENVSPQIPIAKIVNMDVIKVKIDIVERDLPKVKEDQLSQVKVDAYPEEIFEGKVSMVSPVIDLTTRTAPLEIEISNPEHILKSGMFARVRIDVLEHKGVPYILRDAVIRENGEMYCFIIKDGKACKRKIITGMSEEDKIEVTDGIQEGDSVVITGQQGLKDGQAVEIISKGAQE